MFVLTDVKSGYTKISKNFFCFKNSTRTSSKVNAQNLCGKNNMCGLNLFSVFALRLFYCVVLCFSCPRSIVMIVTFM